MNIKLLTLSAVASSILIAASPMVSTSMSTDNGGTKLAIDAYSDGGGVMLINQAADTKVDNSAMNKLVFKYGEAAKASNTTLKNQVTVLESTSTELEKSDATSKLEIAKIVINPPVNGTSCSDNNLQTINDVYTGGTCVGTSVPNGSACDDLNSATSGETWLNGTCQGGIAGNVAGNGLIYDNCEGGSRNWTDATNYCAAKGAGWRLPTFNETNKGASGASGVPQCSATTWSWTSTPYFSVYYVWSASSGSSAFTGDLGGVRCVK